MGTTWKSRNAVGNARQLICIGGPGSTTVGETVLALDSAYTYGSSGDAVMFAFVPEETGNLTDFWVKVSAYTGTWGSTDGVINVQVREGLNGSNIPGTSLTGSFTITLDGSTTGWIKKSGLSISLTAGKVYTIVIADADGSAGNFVTLIHKYDSQSASTVTGSPFVPATITSTSGFSSAGTSANGSPAFVLKQNGVIYGGGGFSTIATTASSTVERGLRFQVPEKCTLMGVYMPNDTSLLWVNHTFKLYADGTSPGGSALTSVTQSTTTVGGGTAPLPTSFLFPAASRYDLAPGTWYRLVVDPVSNLTAPRKCTIGGSPDADVLAAFLPFGNGHWIEESGGAWDDSQTTATPMFGPILAPNDVGAPQAMMRVGGGVIPMF